MLNVIKKFNNIWQQVFALKTTPHDISLRKMINKIFGIFPPPPHKGMDKLIPRHAVDRSN